MDNGFSFESYLKLLTIDERLEYVNNHLKKLGCGSSRCAFLTDDGLVLKTSRNPNGINQNRHEIMISNKGKYNEVIGNIYKTDSNGRWLFMERLFPISDEDFQRGTNLKFSHFFDICAEYYGSLEQKRIINEFNNKWLSTFISIIDDFQLFDMDDSAIMPDYYSFEHFGKDKEGRIKLMDYGLF